MYPLLPICQDLGNNPPQSCTPPEAQTSSPHYFEVQGTNFPLLCPSSDSEPSAWDLNQRRCQQVFMRGINGSACTTPPPQSPATGVWMWLALALRSPSACTLLPPASAGPHSHFWLYLLLSGLPDPQDWRHPSLPKVSTPTSGQALLPFPVTTLLGRPSQCRSCQSPSSRHP